MVEPNLVLLANTLMKVPFISFKELVVRGSFVTSSKASIVM